MTKAFIIGYTVLVTGCATTPLPTEQTALIPSSRIYSDKYLEAKPGFAKVIVKRDSPRIGVDCDNLIFVDAERIALIEPAERLELYLSVGEHVIGVSKPTCGGELRELAIVPVASQPKTLRVWSDQDGHLQLQQTAF